MNYLFSSFLLMFFLLSSCSISTPSKGQKIGVIVKLSECGVFNKTWEGELIRGGLSDGSGVIGSTFHFTIEDPVVLELAVRYFEDQREVQITYQTEFIAGIWRAERPQPCFIKKIIPQKE
jgi:hypothetical protein